MLFRSAATCDTWSNESVQNLKLLGGMAPICSLEQLIYDCRLMNQALAEGELAGLTLQRWLVASDAGRDPQAYILTPANALAIGEAIVAAADEYNAGKNAALKAIALLREGYHQGCLKIADREIGWLDTMEEQVASLPARADEFIDQMLGVVDTSKFVPGDYDL